MVVPVNMFFKCLYNSIVERQSCKLNVLGPIPSGGSCASNQQSYPLCTARFLPAELIRLQHLSVPTDMPKPQPAVPYPRRKDSLAERSKTVAQGAIPRGHGLEPTADICCAVADVESRKLDWQFHSSTTSQSPSPVRPRQLRMVCLIIQAPLSLHSRGESGWCSDVTSTHGAWRHAGIRFLLPGDRSSGMYYIQPEDKRSQFSARRGAWRRCENRTCQAPIKQIPEQSSECQDSVTEWLR
jgi:hypothetical protein